VQWLFTNIFMKPIRFLLAAIVLGISLTGACSAQTTAVAEAARWAQAAKTMSPGFEPSAARGKAFYSQVFTNNKEFPNCAACHTANPAGQGKHAITGKTIAPLAPSANTERFTDAAKTDKWFKRNCNDVLGRECTAPEKADFVTYLIGIK
jgi:Domain of unknown function (DUF1924)